MWLVVAATAMIVIGSAGPAVAFGPPVPSAESASTTAGVPVRVTLEATDDFGSDAQVAFAIVTSPSHGSLGALGPVSCSSTPTTSDCTTSVNYTPMAGYAGSDGFSYLASDQFASSSAATVTLSVAPSPALPPTPSTPPPPTPVILPPEGALGVALGTVAPGATATVGLPGVSASLAAAPSDQGSVAVATATYAPTHPAFVAAGPQGLVLAAFDVRAVGAGPGDTLVVRFSYAQIAGNPEPTLEFFDPVSNGYVPVRGSALATNSLVIDTANHTITAVLDRTSAPALTNLTGTRFAVVAGMPLVAQRVGPQLLLDKRALDFVASCGPVACRLTASGTLAIPGVAHRWRLGRSEDVLGARQYKRVHVTTSASLRAAARKFLRAHRGRLRVRLEITVAGPDNLRRTKTSLIAIRTLPNER